MPRYADGAEVSAMDSKPMFIDPKIVDRTAARFAVKRKAFAPDAVEDLASFIVRRLASSATTIPSFDPATISENHIAAFCDALIEPGPTAAVQFIQDRRLEGVTRHGVYLGYICAAARRLGDMWDDGRLTFLQVTIGTGHLYALMRALRSESSGADTIPDAGRSALFATVPGECHGIGITVAADLFREAGWEIDLQTGTDHDSLMERVERSRPDIIGLTLSTDSRLEALARLVVALRFVVPHAIIGVAPGVDLDPKRVQELVDIDLIFGDARSACMELDRLVRLRA